MRRSVSLPVLAGLALAAAAPASAQDVTSDVRCLIASNVFAANEKDPQRKEVAIAALMFYSGRVDARLTVAQLKPQIVAQGRTLTGQTIGVVMTACAKRLGAQQLALQEAFKQLAAAQAGK